MKDPSRKANKDDLSPGNFLSPGEQKPPGQTPGAPPANPNVNPNVNPKATPKDTIDFLNEQFHLYTDHFSKQFHLKIPKNVVKRVSDYRDTYFSYLKDSVYKSNICYLLQLLDYQLWLYRIFHPSLSLENAYFYQLLVTMGIGTEALCVAILLDPLLEENGRDRSLGGVREMHANLGSVIVKNSFQANLRALRQLQLIPEPLLETFESFRREIRNSVHIQNWEGRLYESLQYDYFRKKLDDYRKFLSVLNAEIKISHDAMKLEKVLLGDTILSAPPAEITLDSSDASESRQNRTSRSFSRYLGRIVQFQKKGGYGFIAMANGRQIYFHVSQLENLREKDVTLSMKVEFSIQTGKKGYEAAQITLYQENKPDHQEPNE